MFNSPSTVDSITIPVAPVPAAAVRIDDLTIRYAHHVALQHVTLSFEARMITAVIGPSGCGKSSLLSSLNRLTDLIPDCHVSGRVQIGELDVYDRKTCVTALRRRVGMIFQRPNPFPMSIRGNLELPLREHGLRGQAEVSERIEGALNDVGLWNEVKDRMDRPALALSGGQQQRLCLARALVLNPEILLLDEPCSALDPVSTGIVEDLLLRLRSRCTIVIVTHNLAQARRISEQTAVFWGESGVGRLIEFGNTREVFDSAREPVTANYVAGRIG